VLQYLTGEKQRQSRGWHTKCFSGIRATPSLVLCVGFSGVRAPPSLVLCVCFSGVRATPSLVLCVGFSGVRATPSLVLCVGFLDRCLSFCLFFFWPLCCMFFFYSRILITPLVSFGHCVVCSSSIYGF
jgi:hypothetical protein